MNNFLLHNESVSTMFLVEKDASLGIKKVTGKVLDDYNAITKESGNVSCLEDLTGEVESAVIACTVDDSILVSNLEKKGAISIDDVRGKWEVFKFFTLKTQKVKNLLLVVGSDKLGTIYGLFTLSEKMGVSPLKYWADSVMPSKSILNLELEEQASKEPSVKFRGFFINDEWPCFGNWTMEHFGGFTAEMYDNVFELLLRLKGNYLWPAMWSSSFAWDGPGLKSYELADEYGIYIGNSHHEPCLRAGEEYRHVRGKDSIYGDAWNYHANTEGITRFWKDSLDERGMFTSMVTVGMRGEADSTILGANATLKDNIDLLKDVIVCQKKLIKETEEKYSKKFPKVLALYKEVEPFYYGDKDTEGLCEWEELDDVILMLCEDNHGYLRTVPDDKMRKHPAGFGMYYHVDYHGDPISYEWINSSPITTMWEQMSQAYDYGVRSVWILNVGDLKHNEFPLSYFLNLAYDFEKWGTTAPNKTFEYTKTLMDSHFGGTLTQRMVEEASEILTETVRINGYRRPETLNQHIYSPCHFGEADRLLLRLEALEKKLISFEEGLDESQKQAWYSLSGFQTRATLALIRMHLNSGKNELFASQGLVSANDYADKVALYIAKDKELKKDFANFNNHKWRGMELASHVGFTKWNEDGSKYPLKIYVEPFDRPRMYVSRTDDEKIYDKVYGPCMRIKADDFEYEGTDSFAIRVSNAGTGVLDVTVNVPENDWVKADKTALKVEKDEIITFSCNRQNLSLERKSVIAVITDGDTKVEIEISGQKLDEKIEKGVFLPGKFGYSILAVNYDKAFCPEGIGFVEIDDYSVYDKAVKAYPVRVVYEEGKEPSLDYRLFAKESEEYTLRIDFAPTSPLSRDNRLFYGVSVNGENAGVYNTVPEGYRAGVAFDRTWSEGVLTHRRKCISKVTLEKGVNNLTLILKDAGLVPMKLYLYKEEPPISYFGMPESARR